MSSFTGAQEARDYIKQFNVICGKNITEVTMSGGEVIHLDCMSDSVAIRVANCLLEIESEENRSRQQ